MIRKKYKSLILPISLIVLSLVVIVSTTLAYFTDKQSSDNPVSFGKVEITAGEMETLSTPLRDVIAGSKITDKITFSKAVDSESMYVRAKAYFSTDSTVQAVKDLVAELNTYNLGAMGESSAYSWSAKYNNIHYLIDKTDTSKAYALTNNDLITLSNGFSIPTTLKQSENLAQYMQKVSFNIEIQAVQSATVDAEVKNVDTYFVDIFGDSGIAPYTTGKFTNVSGTAGYTDNENLVGKYFIEMGSYPQSFYTGEASALTEAVGETYNLSCEVDYDVVTVSDCQVYKDASDNRYVKFTNSSSVVNYYKVEPVRWVVIGKADGTALPADFDIDTTPLSKLLVISEKVLTQRIFNPNVAHTTINGDQAKNDWAGSELNTYMNETLISELFTEEAQALIQDTTLKTHYDPVSNGVATEIINTSKLFPLATNVFAGGSTYLVNLLNDGEVELGTQNPALLAKASALAVDMGLYVYPDTGCSSYWLRSGVDNSQMAVQLNAAGRVDMIDVSYTFPGVRPACVIALR